MPQSGDGKSLLFFFRLAAFAGGALACFLALGAVGGALHQLGAHQLDHGLFGAIALARAQTHDAGVAAVALAETGGQRVEQLLHRGWREEHPGGFAAVPLGTVVMTRSCSIPLVTNPRSRDLRAAPSRFSLYPATLCRIWLTFSLVKRGGLGGRPAGPSCYNWS